MHRRLPAVLAPVLALLVVLTGCSASASPAAPSDRTVAVQHAQGATDVPADPKKIVVIDHASLDTLQTLGVADRVVGIPKRALPPSLEAFKGDQVTDVGTLQEPDVEKIAALGPDLIVLGSRSAPKYAELAELAPTVDMTVDAAKPIESLRERTLALASLVGAEEKATSELDAIGTSIDEAKTLASDRGTSLILLTTGGKVSAYGPGGRFGNLIHDTLGVTPAATQLKEDRHGQAVSFEFISQTNPDRLFVIDRDAAIGQQGKSAKQVLDNTLVRTTKAWKDDAVTYLDGADWYVIGYGLTTTKTMVEDVREALRS